MKKVIKLISLLVVILIAPVIILFGLSLFHHKTVHNELVDFINKELDGKITFQEFSFSYLRHFPRVHINLRDISVKDDTTEIAKITNLDLLLNLKGFWGKKLKVERLTLNDGEIHLITDSLGHKPHIFGRKNKSSSTSPGAWLVNENNIKILNFRLYITNEIKGNSNYIHIKDAQFELITQDSLLLLKGSFEGELDSLISNNSLLFKGLPLEGRELVFTIDRYSGVNILKEGYVMVHALKIEPRLKIKHHKDGNLIELHLLGEDNFNDILTLFEFHTGIDLIQVNSDAKLKISYNLNGFVNPFLRPYSELDFDISEAEFTSDDLPFPIKLDRITGNYNNGEEHLPGTAVLQIDTVLAEVSDSFIKGRFKLSNLKDPFVDAHFISQMDMTHLIKQTDNFSLSGIIYADLVIDGKISELKKMHFEGKQQAIGSIEVKNLELVLNDKNFKMEIINGSSLLNNHIFEVTSLVGAFNESAFHFQGNFDNLDEYILEDNKNLMGKFAFNFDKLDLRKLNFKSKEKKPARKSGGLSHLENMAVDFVINGNEIVTEIGSIKNLKMNSSLENQIFFIKTLDFLYQDGSIEGNGRIFFNEQGIDSVIASVNGKFQNLNINIPVNKHKSDSLQKKSFKFPFFLDTDIDLEIVRGEIMEEQFNNCILQANIKGPEVIVQKFKVYALNGNTNIKGRFVIGETGLVGLWANADLNFNLIDANYLINKFHKKDTSSTSKKGLQFPKEMDVKINLSSKKIVYRDAIISNYRSNIQATEKQIAINNLFADLAFGNIQIDLLISDYQNDKISYQGSANLSIDSLALDKLLKMKAFGIPDQAYRKNKAVNSNKKNRFLTLPDNINITLNTTASYLSYKNANINNLKFLIDYNDKNIALRELNYQFADGIMKIHGQLTRPDSRDHSGRSDDNNSHGYLYSKADSIDIQKFFGSFNNFGQDVFTAENSSGKISWASHYYFKLDNQFKLVSDDNLWLVNAIIHSAEFDQVAPIEKTLFFVGHKSKDKMIVSELDINAFMFGSKVYFSDVLMNDNIANLDVFGEVDTDKKEMDLGIEISLSDLFFRSKKKKLVETQEGIVNLDPDDKLFLRMSGTFTDHKLKLISKKKFNNNRNSLMKNIKTAEREFDEVRNK